MTLERICLENFEEGNAPLPQESAEFRRGYEAAMRAAEDAHEAATLKALDELASTLGDMAFGYEEARAYLSKRLHHLLVQLAETALPSILQSSFGAHLNDVILTHFAEQAGQPIRIAVSPKMEAALSSSGTRGWSHVQFDPDSSLTRGQAVLCDGESRVMLDLPALLDVLQTTLTSFEPFERKETHG